MFTKSLFSISKYVTKPTFNLHHNFIYFNNIHRNFSNINDEISTSTSSDNHADSDCGEVKLSTSYEDISRAYYRTKGGVKRTVSHI